MRIQYLLKSSFVTPTKATLIAEPTQPCIALRKLEMPASTAKLVASILLGQIFAIKTVNGRIIKHCLNESAMVPEKMIKEISGRPHVTLRRKTRM